MFLLQDSRILLVLLLAGGHSACPSGCRCYSLTVECGSLGLRHVPRGVPDHIQTIFLQDNAIVQIRGLDLSGLGQLLHLYLQNNSISAVEPGAFLGQGPLLELALNGNQIHLLTPGTFTGLDHLRILYLAANQITQLQDHAFIGLQRLQELHLEQNGLEVLGEHALSGLSSLALLDLSRNQLHTLGAASLQPLISLQVLRLTENPWRCDCGLHWLRLWVDAEGQRLLSWSERRLLCVEPPRLVHLSLVEVAPNSLVCIPPVLQLEASHLTVHLGESLKVSCQASGYPQPLVTWRKTPQGRAHLGPRGLLQEGGGDGDRGRAQGAGAGAGRGGARGSVGEGSEVKRGKGDVTGGAGTEEGDRFDSDTGSGMLFLSNVTVAHAGRYECEARNPGGVAHLTFHLAVNMTSSSALWPQLHSSSSSPLYPRPRPGEGLEPLYDEERMDFSALRGATQTAIAVGIALLTLTALLLLFMIYSRQQQHRQTDYSNSSSKDNRILYENSGPANFALLEDCCDAAGHQMYVLNSSQPALTTHSGHQVSQPAGLRAKQQRVLVLQEALQAQGQAGCLGSGRTPVDGTDGARADPGELLLTQSLLYEPQTAYQTHCCQNMD